MSDAPRGERLFLALGSVFGFLAVTAGAFGAHALRGRLSADLLQTFEVAARYQMYHALALLAVAWAASRRPGPFVTAAGWLFTIGTVIFSGSLYVLAATGMTWWGAVTPIGGVCLLAAWAALAWSACRRS